MSKESVWDYPRPPRAESTPKRIRVYFGGELVADTNRAIRILETSHPPVYYIPREDVQSEYLKPSARRSFCEFKGSAAYWTLEVAGKISEDAAWSYQHPERDYEVIRGCLAFYASKADECFVDEERVQPQAGSFYGGWVTSDIVGPFKGGSGSSGW
jgi:uncharacterized protein (DUF427 family)